MNDLASTVTRPRYHSRRLACLLTAALTALPTIARATEEARFRPAPAPPFPVAGASTWIGEPQTWESLRGRVVLLDVWTFGCINCVRTIPWVREMAERYGSRGLSVIGIHTPEFSFERGREAVGAEVRKHGLDFPHLIDDDRSYWNALGVYAWPSLFLVDRCGTLRARAVGEVHSGEESGRRFEAELRALLAEAPGACGR